MNRYTTYLKSVGYLAQGIASQDPSENITDRQEKVFGFDQLVMNNLRVLQIGAGGLGGEIAQGLVRKGVGTLKIFDGDTVSLSNLSRQFFYKEDLCKNKAICLGNNLLKESIRKTQIISYPFMFQKAVEDKVDISCDVVICAPDNNEVRIYASKLFQNKTPVIFTALDREASTGYVLIQKPKGACFGCVYPNAVADKREPCPNTSAIIDLVKIISGFVLFAVDSTVMERKSNWNFRQVFVNGFAPEVVRITERKKDCPLCGPSRIGMTTKKRNS